MGCAASHEEPPKQEPSKQKPSPKQSAKDHPRTQKPSQQQQTPGQSQTQRNDTPDGTVKNNDSAPLTKESLQTYLRLEKEIHRLEGKNVGRTVRNKQEAVEQQKKHVEHLKEHYKTCVDQTEKEKADVDHIGDVTVGGLIVENETFVKEKSEYVESLNKQEIAKKELEEANRQLDLLMADHERVSKEEETLNNLHTEHEDLLAGIFEGEYGSEKENKLESELMLLLERKQRIGVAKYKWKNGRVLIQYACNQLAYANKKWAELKDAPMNDLKLRYTLATDTRNNLVAANQNLSSAQRYLNTIEFPYCKLSELETLQRASNNIYTDMQTPDRTMHALNVYHVTHRRAVALLQWFDHVITGTIVQDAAKVKQDTSSKEKELRAERVHLIQGKVREVLGDDVNLEVETDTSSDDMSDVEDEPDEELMVLAAKTDTDSDNLTDPSRDKPMSPGPTPLPLEELAPAPSNDDLFGNIDDLKRQHEKEMAEFDKAQELNKARVEQDLQEKLRARRSRRKRAATQNAQTGSTD